MYDSKLFSLLKTLRQYRREIFEFEKFVKSPYFNTRKELVDLLLFIKRFWKDSEEQQRKKMTKEAAFKAVFPKRKQYQAWRINEVISDLSMLLEDFFAIQEVKRNQGKKDMLIVDALKNRAADKYYFKKTSDIAQALAAEAEQEKATNADFYRVKMWLGEHVYYHPNHHKHSIKKNDDHLIQMMENLDQYYITKKLQYACEVFSRQKIYGFDYSVTLLEELSTLAMQSAANPVQKAYLAIIDLFKNGATDKIPDIKKQIEELVEHSTIDCKLDLILKFFNALPNFPERIKLYFELYIYALEQQVLIEHGHIAPDHFNNIIYIGCALKKYDWVDNFIEENSKFLFLGEEKQENTQQLFSAYSKFYKQEYRQAFILLDGLKIEDITYGLRYHALLIMTMVEGKDKIGFRFDFHAHCSNFKRYAGRKYKEGAISKVIKDGCLRFVNTANKIHNWSYRQWDKDALRKELNSYEEIPNKGWLLVQIDKLD